MTTFHGRAGAVEIGGNVVAEVREFEVEETAEFSEDSILSDTARTTHLTDRTGWSGRITAWWDDTDTTGQGLLLPGQTVTLELGPEGVVNGDFRLTGSGRITRERTRVAEGVNEIEFEFEGSGVLTRDTFPV